MKGWSVSKADQVRDALKDEFAVNPMSGGDGLSIETAVVIHRGAPNDVVGTQYAFIDAYLGQKPKAWEIAEQSLASTPSGRKIDRLKVIKAKGAQSEFVFYFDVTEAMGGGIVVTLPG